MAATGLWHLGSREEKGKWCEEDKGKTEIRKNERKG
jgi:hypothetical protein